MANILTFANDTLTDANIFGGINYICDLNTGDEFSIGNTASACVSFVTDTQVPLYTKDQTNGVFEWTQDNTSRGTYYVTEVTKDNGPTYTVTAYDAMILLDTSITALSLTYPLTVATAAAAIATYIGCTTSGTIYNGTMAAADGTIDDTTTIRQLLSWVAEASGASVKIDAADHIVFLYYASSGITVTASDYKEYGLEVADYTCAAIDNVTICDMAGMTAATAGSGTNSLFIQGNPFLYDATSTEAATILGLVDSFVYAPFKCEMFEENGLEVGTIATFGTTTTLVMHIESGEGGAVASAVGSDSRAELNKSLDIMINEALSAASNAQDQVDALNLHFWYTATGSEAGAHIAEVSKPTFEANPSGGNLLSSSNGIAVRDGLTELATFGASRAQIGKGDEAHLELDYGSMQLVDRDGNSFFRIFDLNDAQGRYEKTEQYTGYHMQVVIDGVTYYAVGLDEYAESVISVTVNGVSKVSPTDYILYTQQTYGTSLICFTYNIGTTATVVVSYYVDSDALKAYTIGTRATGDVGLFSVAEGYETVASGKHSHAQNINTIASGFAQTAIGRYNNNKINTAFEIGNGSSDSSRSNALTVDWNGNVRINGDLYVGCNADSSGGALLKVLKVTKSSVSSLNTTISNSAITANMECIHSVLSNPSAQTGDWTVTTSAGSAVISGSISGTTDITLYLAVPRT